MKPKVAHIAARIQIAILMGTVPFAVLVALIALPFGLMNAVYALFGTVIFAIGLSSIGIPIFGIVISNLWLGDAE